MPDQLAVSALMELLAKFPPDAKVWVEGCDCYGKASGVNEYEYDDNPELFRPPTRKGVLITRWP